MTTSTTPGFALWLTGLPASGKSTLARELQRLLHEHDVAGIVLDSDEVRRVLTPEPTYSEEERDWVYGVIAWLATWLTTNGINVVIAATAHRQAYRDQARAQIARFAEVDVRCSLDICRARDRKGIYKGASIDHANAAPGVGVRYEAPCAPDAVVDTGQHAPTAAAWSVLEQLHAVLHLPVRPEAHQAA